MAAARIVVVVYRSACTRAHVELIEISLVTGIPSRCLKIAFVDCWVRPFLVPPGIRNACGRTALGGERSESGPPGIGYRAWGWKGCGGYFGRKRKGSN